MAEAPTVAQVAAHLAGPLDAGRYAREGDPAGVWIGSDRPVRRLGLRLEAGRPPYAWADGLDAVLLHRPFGLWPARFPSGVGVLAYHRALDDRLSVGPNPALAHALGLEPEGGPLRRGGEAVGLVGALPSALPFRGVRGRLVDVLGGVAAEVGPAPREVGRVALVGAMTEALVAEAAERGARLYVTGQIRQPGVVAAGAHGVRVIAVGQGRGERWGLRRLGAIVGERWPGVEIVDRSGWGATATDGGRAKRE